MKIWLARASSASIWAAAVIWAVTVWGSGPYLAVGLALYGGAMEPSMPSLPFPGRPAAALLTISLLSALAEPIGEKIWLHWISSGLALAASALITHHLWLLTGAASQ